MKKYLKYLNLFTWFKKPQKEVTEKEINQYIEKNRKQIEESAVDIYNDISDSWFNLKQFISRVKNKAYKDPKNVLHLLNNLKLAGYLVARMNTDSSGNRVEEYKITLTKAKRLTVLQGEEKRLKILLQKVQEEIKVEKS